MLPTAHIEAKNKDDFAKTVLMPGDPLRAKFIAETFLSNIVEVNSVRGMLAYTGEYKGEKVSVMGSGMGMPSIGIYSYELFKFYNVENIIRIGSCGSYTEDLNLYDVLVCDDAWSESTFPSIQSGKDEGNIIKASEKINNLVVENSQKLDIPVTNIRVHSSDVFYHEDAEYFKKMRDTYGVMAVEMESFALFHNANILEKSAACILTVSDSLVSHEATTSVERQTSFTKMMEIALNTAISLYNK